MRSNRSPKPACSNPVKICVTGGTGFIGEKVVDALLDLGHVVVIPTRKLSAAKLHDRCQYVALDLLDSAADLAGCLAGCSIVINCAGELYQPSRMFNLHVNATRRLLDAFLIQLKSQGTSGRWVQLSSVGCYGPASPASAIRVVTEQTDPSPVGEYEVTKTLADQTLINIAEQPLSPLSYSILRPSNVCGPNMPNNALRDWAAVIKKNLFVFIGPRNAVSTYVHVRDVVDALIVCAFDSRATNQIFNISNDCLQVELVRAMAAASHSHNPRYRIPEWLARFVARVFGRHSSFPLKESRVDALVARTQYTSEKLHSVLGITPKINIPGAVKEIIG